MSQDSQTTTKNEQEKSLLPRENHEDVLMVHKIPKDYTACTLNEQRVLQNGDKEAILRSELRSKIPQLDNESDVNYAKRYSNTLNDMIRRGVQILGDQTTHDLAPNLFSIGGHNFDVSPKSGITKREYRELSEQIRKYRVSYQEIPERFLKFEMMENAEEPSYDIP